MFFSFSACDVTGSIDEYDLKCKPVLTGVTLIIPCGPSTSSCGNDEALYTYRNDSNDQLLKNSSSFLEIETKFYQNGNKIICVKKGCGRYSYELNILCTNHCLSMYLILYTYIHSHIIKSHSFHTVISFVVDTFCICWSYVTHYIERTCVCIIHKHIFIVPPTGVHGKRKKIGTFDEKYHQSCPVQANPSPMCTWTIFYCGSNNSVDVSIGITYTNQNCDMIIERLTNDFTDYCYKCDATNEYGTTTVYYNSIIFSCEFNVYIVIIIIIIL